MHWIRIFYTIFFNFTFQRIAVPLWLTKTIIMEHKIHQGRNVKRFREMQGIKQEALAFDLGEDWCKVRCN